MMRYELSLTRRKRRTFTDEFIADTVRLCQQGDRSIYRVAKDLDLTLGSVRRWVKWAEAAANETPETIMTADERQELRELPK